MVKEIPMFETMNLIKPRERFARQRGANVIIESIKLNKLVNTKSYGLSISSTNSSISLL